MGFLVVDALVITRALPLRVYSRAFDFWKRLLTDTTVTMELLEFWDTMLA